MNVLNIDENLGTIGMPGSGKVLRLIIANSNSVSFDFVSNAHVIFSSEGNNLVIKKAGKGTIVIENYLQLISNAPDFHLIFADGKKERADKYRSIFKKNTFHEEANCEASLSVLVNEMNVIDNGNSKKLKNKENIDNENQDNHTFPAGWHLLQNECWKALNGGLKYCECPNDTCCTQGKDPLVLSQVVNVKPGKKYLLELDLRDLSCENITEDTECVRIHIEWEGDIIAVFTPDSRERKTERVLIDIPRLNESYTNISIAGILILRIFARTPCCSMINYVRMIQLGENTGRLDISRADVGPGRFVAMLLGTGIQGDSPVYSISGVDACNFRIAPKSGIIFWAEDTKLDSTNSRSETCSIVVSVSDGVFSVHHELSVKLVEDLPVKDRLSIPSDIFSPNPGTNLSSPWEHLLQLIE